jgi:hypothetical protein
MDLDYLQVASATSECLASQLLLLLSLAVVGGARKMLRITIHNEVAVTRIVIEGRLMGPWVAELQRCWEAAASAKPRKSIFVDLTEVTFIDAKGGELLALMHQDGARLTAPGLTKHMIDDAIRCSKKEEE